MSYKQTEELHQYTHFLENRIDSLEEQVQDVQQLLAILFEIDDEEVQEEPGFSIRFCTCDHDDDTEEDEDDDEEDDDDEWY